MGIERNHSPGYFRKRAEEFRAKADNCEHGEPRAALDKIAKTYDELALRAQKIRTAQQLLK